MFNIQNSLHRIDDTQKNVCSDWPWFALVENTHESFAEALKSTYKSNETANFTWNCWNYED